MLNLETGKVEYDDGGSSRSPSGSPIESPGQQYRDPVDEEGLAASLRSPTSWRVKGGKNGKAESVPSLSDISSVMNTSTVKEETRVRGQSLSPVALMGNNSNPFQVSSVVPVLEPPTQLLQKYLTNADEVKHYNSPPPKRPEMVQIRRYKVTLVGAGEAGKTSLRKCFASNPLFFKNLPDVGTTTGIDVQQHRLKSGGQQIDLEIHDFAGQEVYHSHSLFLSNRTLFLFVWNMSAIEQTFDDYGISPQEESRLKRWADVVQAKCPGAAMIVIGTHKDMLRDSSRKTIVLILNKVCRLLSDYIETFKPQKGLKNIFIGGSFCVSCKDRSVIPENQGGPTKIKELLQWAAELCSKYSKTDSITDQGSVPRYVISLVATLTKLRNEKETVLLPMKTYNNLAKQLGIPKELLHKVTTMLHDWGVLYLFDKQASKLGRQDCVFLHPQWLSQMVATVFTFAHACTAPAHERGTMEIDLIDVNECIEAEPSRLVLEGVLTTALARPLFSKILRQLKREPTNQNIDICFMMLANLDIVYRNVYLPESGPLPTKKPPSTQYYVPSIFPRDVPPNLSTHLSRLMRNRGVHTLFKITPFPKEFLQMLHCRAHQYSMRLQVNAPCPEVDPPTRKVQNNWRDGMWMGAGGGEGSDLGLGPLRGFMQATLEKRELDVWAVAPPDIDDRTMSVSDLSKQFGETLKELCHKYPGLYIEETIISDKTDNTLEDETFVVLTSAMKPGEVRFLLKCLSFDITDQQQDKLTAIVAASEASEDPQSPVGGNLKLSLLLDKLIKACMLQDPSLSVIPGMR
eukprot:TRINITY_DN14649_c0_g1_i2.p1 TRINITY_DN14649_c0_g1~~TRINITY_DN14649_c0_g1_i2.p1  ORF type:complete len:817 (+),score=182.07 TRINITY_DN14649_c0_g1_i2:59-2452(+)